MSVVCSIVLKDYETGGWRHSVMEPAAGAIPLWNRRLAPFRYGTGGWRHSVMEPAAGAIPLQFF